MKEQLAERLLARVMNWDAEDVAAERPILQAMAAYKYDEYQQFYPGMRFLESLALWLSDLTDPAHKKEAYQFVRKRLIFFSNAEIQHLVSIAYPDFIRLRILRRAAEGIGLNPYYLGQVAASTAFSVFQRSCLFLGLSDGARTDFFRRCNEEAISHEQILQSYEITEDRVGKLLKKLREDLIKIDVQLPNAATAQFSTVVLLDDFSASGTSYLRSNADGGIKGKIHEFSRDILNVESAVAKLVDPLNTRIILLLYIATEQAVSYLTEILTRFWAPSNIQFEIVVVHLLTSAIRIQPGDPLEPILEHYYDKQALEDEHTSQGGQGVKFGYAGCGLPVVLSHNTPNNSIYPLWARPPKLRALFPRVSRHKEL